MVSIAFLTCLMMIALDQLTSIILNESQNNLEKQWMLINCKKCYKELPQTVEKLRKKISTTLWLKNQYDMINL